jgi:hypothetical protein
MTYAPLNYKFPYTTPADRYWRIYSRRKVVKLYLHGFQKFFERRRKTAALSKIRTHRKLTTFLIERAKRREDNADRASIVYFYRKKDKWITTADAKEHFKGITK